MKTLLVLLGAVCTLASAQDVNFGDAEDSSSPSEEFDTSEDTSEKVNTKIKLIIKKKKTFKIITSETRDGRLFPIVSFLVY